MADSFSKKTQQQKKAKKKQDKLDRKEERKSNNNKGKSLDDMIVYLDEFGNLTDIPPDQQKRSAEINLEDIQLGAAPIIEETEFTGVLTSFFDEKAFGFITEDKTKLSVFVHSNNFLEPIKEKDRVVFGKEKTPKGMAAIQVKKLKN